MCSSSVGGLTVDNITTFELHVFGLVLSMVNAEEIADNKVADKQILIIL